MLLTLSDIVATLIPLSTARCCARVPRAGPAVVREVDARPWEPSSAARLVLLHQEAYEPKDRPHRLTVDREPHRELRAAQCGGDCEKAFTRTTPPTIRARPISAGTSSVCRNQNHPTKAIKTMPRPAHMA